jgi:hypothetical protein
MTDYRSILAKQLVVPGVFPARFAFSIHKCGSSLMNAMIHAACKQAKVPALSIPDTFFLEGLDESWSRDPSLLPLIDEGRIYFGFRYLPPIFFQPGFLKGRKSVLLVRDPRDALVSEYYSFGGKHLSHKQPTKNVEGFREKLDSTKHMEIDEYVLMRAAELLIKLTSYREHLDFDNALLRRYEDIYFDKEQFLADIFSHFRIDVPANIIAKVAAANDVRPESEDPSKHIRKGTPGDHREKLAPETIASLNDTFRDAARFFGYDLDA